jgi:hypothetical protein
MVHRGRFAPLNALFQFQRASAAGISPIQKAVGCTCTIKAMFKHVSLAPAVEKGTFKEASNAVAALGACRLLAKSWYRPKLRTKEPIT